MNNIKLSRKELYDLVWSTPLTALAKKYVISDSGLRKICKRMEIPLPKVGHWSKLKAGKIVKVPALSSNYNKENEVVLAERKEGDNSTKDKLSPELELKQKIESDDSINILVPDKLKNPHPLIVEFRKADENRNVYGRNRIHADNSKLRIFASKPHIDRAVRIMDTFIKVMEKRGHHFELSDRGTFLIMQSEKFEIKLKERDTRIEKPSKMSWKEYDYIPSGILSFIVKISFTEIEWKDGKFPLENQISKIVAKLEIKAEQEKEETLRRKKAWEIRDNEMKIEKAKQQKIEEEWIKFKVLKQKAQRWQEACQIRAYLSALEAEAIKTEMLTTDLQEYLAWATQKVNCYDPTVSLDDELMLGVDKETLTIKKSSFY